MQGHSEERGNKINKEKKQQTYEPLGRFTWVKTNVQRCEGQRAQRIAKRCERYVECRRKTGADGMGWFMWCLFQYNSYLKYSSKSTDRIFR